MVGEDAKVGRVELVDYRFEFFWLNAVGTLFVLVFALFGLNFSSLFPAFFEVAGFGVVARLVL